jgi:hypothetical protein
MEPVLERPKASLPPLPRKKTMEDTAWVTTENVVDKQVKKSRASSTLIEPIENQINTVYTK